MKNPSKFNLLFDSKMKLIVVLFICLLAIVNTHAANLNDLKLELETTVKLTSIVELKSEDSEFKNTSINPVEKNIKKNTLIDIADNFRNRSTSKEESSITNISNSNISWNSYTGKTWSYNTTTNSTQEDTLDLGSALTRDYLANKKRAAAFTPTTIYTHSKKLGKLKLKAKVKSIKFTVYF